MPGDHKHSFFKIFVIISVLLFLVSVITMIIGGIMGIIHAFRNPENTITQNFLWVWNNALGKISIPCTLITYICILLFKDKIS